MKNFGNWTGKWIWILENRFLDLQKVESLSISHF